MMTTTVLLLAGALPQVPGVPASAPPAPGVTGQDPASTKAAEIHCTVDLRLPGMMKDIVSNALLLGAKQRPEADVAAFLANAETRHATGDDLLRAAARHFGIAEPELLAEVERFRHCNCDHGTAAGAAPGRGPAVRPGRPAVEVSAFARDVALHVVLHELGHALVREFDLPILGNEETMADAFATHYLTAYLPERAADVLVARTKSLMHEARQVPREQWPVRGEHDNDARRAFQIAALAVAADATRYAAVAQAADLSPQDIQRAKDYGAEIHRSWRRVLGPLWMPPGVRSMEARVVCDEENVAFAHAGAIGLVAEVESIVTRFDWHSQVTVHFAAGDGGAGWSRSKRAVTVHSQYLRRFVEQGRAAGF